VGKLPKKRRQLREKSSLPDCANSDAMAVQQSSESEITAGDIQGLKFFKQVRPLLEPLHDVGTRRDKSGNRDLHMDQYCVLVLMWMFNPVLTSLGSLSESVTVFDPEPLKQIAAALATKVPSADPSKFDVIGKRLTAVDGSVFKTAVRIASLAWLPGKGNGKNKGKTVTGYRMHTHFELLRGIPDKIDATPAKPKGKDDEKAVLASVLQPDRCYVTDRLAGVCIDREVVLGAHTSNAKTVVTDHPVRYIEIEVPPHVRCRDSNVRRNNRLPTYSNLHRRSTDQKNV
jgi:hypothetical protein